MPLIYKRYKMSTECSQLAAEIDKKTLMTLSGMSRGTLRHVIKQILDLTLATEKRSNASLTWGRRKTLLKYLDMQIESKNEELLYLLEMGEVNAIVNNLQNTSSSLKLRK